MTIPITMFFVLTLLEGGNKKNSTKAADKLAIF
jgi:hypothetical protein